METACVTLRLPSELIEKVDVMAAIAHTNRIDVVEEALREYVEDIEGDDRYKEAVVDLYLDDQIEFAVLSDFIGRRDAEAVRASKHVLELGETLADDLTDQ